MNTIRRIAVWCGVGMTLAGAVRSASAQVATYELLVSTAPDRSLAVPLEGTTLSDNLYVFTSPDTDVAQVRFYLDDPQRLAPFKVENFSPYDFAGTSGSSALPFDSNSLADGAHTIAAELDTHSGDTVVVSATFTLANFVPSLVFSTSLVAVTLDPDVVSVENVGLDANDLAVADYSVSDDAAWLTISPSEGITPQMLDLTIDTTGLTSGSHIATVTAVSPTHDADHLTVSVNIGGVQDLLVSVVPERLNPVTLNGYTATGDIYVFVSPEQDIARVQFFLDDPAMIGPPIQTESKAPYDFAGTGRHNGGLPFDTSSLGDGPHNITALVDLQTGGNSVISADFVADNSLVALLFDTSALSFTLDEGQVDGQAVTLSTSDGNPADYTLSDDADWLTVTPTSGSLPGESLIALDVDSTGLAPGQHSAQVSATANGYLPTALSVTLNVNAEGYDLFFSRNPDRSAAEPLEGGVLDGVVYVFTTPDDGVSRVSFYLDDPTLSGPPMKVENKPPFDLGGTESNGDAAPFDSFGLTDGAHTLTAVLQTPLGNVSVSSDFEVYNNIPRLQFETDPAALATVPDGSAMTTVTLSASDDAVVDFSLSGGASWLMVSTSDASTPEAIELTADAAGLTPGMYMTTLTANAVGGGYLGATIDVTLNVVDALFSDQIHLAWVDDPATTITIVWRTIDPTVASTVRYRALGESIWQTVNGAPRPSGTLGTLHEVKLVDLRPNTTYEYAVRESDTAFSATHRTDTAPPTGIAGNFSAVFVADTGIVGRLDGLASGTQQVIDEIAALSPLVVLAGGDYAYYDTDLRYATLDEAIDAWFNQLLPFSTQSALMPTYGNHEVLLGEGFEDWAARFPTPAGYDNRRSYSFDVGNVHFISIHAVQNSSGLPAGQLQWIRDDIEAAQLAGQQWIIPYLHVPPFTEGLNHPQNINLRGQLGPIFESLGVPLVLTAHDQAFERSFPLINIGTTNDPASSARHCYAPTDGVIWAKVSPGGKLSNISGDFSPFATDTLPAWTAVRNNTLHHYAELTVGTGGTLQLDTYGVVGDGSAAVLVDRFVISQSPCTPELAFDSGQLQLSVEPEQADLALVALSRSDAGPADFTVTENADWLSIAPGDGTAPQNLSFMVDAAGLTEGLYITAVTASAPGYLDAHMTVLLDVSDAPPVDLPDLQWVPQMLSVELAEGGPVTDLPATLQTENGAVADFTLTDDATWLTVDVDAGSTPQGLVLTVDPAGLTPDNYSARVTAMADGFDAAELLVTLAYGTGGCFPVACGDILVELPYVLEFDTDHGGLEDAFGTGTGFTYVSMRPDGSGYVPANLELDAAGDVLRIESTAGLNIVGANTQDNAIGVGLDAPSQISVISTTVRNPEPGTGNYEQGGLWFGNDEDNYIKLVFNSMPGNPRVEALLEVDGVVTDFQQSVSLVPIPVELRLTLKANPTDRSVTAEYQVDGNLPVTLVTMTAPPAMFSFDAAGIDPAIGTRTFTGLMTSHRNGPSPVEFVFERFSIAAEPLAPFEGTYQFTQTHTDVPQPTALAWGPDDRLYVTELLGTIHALTFDADKQVIDDEVITTLTDVHGNRLTLGLAVDPASTPTNVALWVSHSSPALFDGLPNSCIVSRLSGGGFATVEDIITGLPRAKANHAVNSLHFGPDGRLYLAAGGNTGAGAPNITASEFGLMEEQPLSAALLVADVFAPGFDGSCHNTADIFGPPPCDVVTYSTGLRNMYDFVFHRNGLVYGPDNGLGVSGSYPTQPTAPCMGLADATPVSEGGQNPGVQPDILVILEDGKYYGHPNPHRGECVFKDGSLQGVSAPANYEPPIFTLGNNTSTNGTIEYMSNAFCGSLDGQLIMANFSVGDNLVRVKLSEDGRAVVEHAVLAVGFDDPLPVTQGPDGTIYVGEFGGNRVTALVPFESGCWTDGTPLPQDILDAGGAALDDKIYVVAGKESDASYLNTVWSFDPLAGSWDVVSDKPGTPVENPAAVAHDGNLYVIGGLTSPFSGAVDQAAVYVPSSDTWSVLSPMPTPRGAAAAQVIDDLIYVVGGADVNGLSLNVVEVYDPATDTWSTVTAMPTPRDNPASAVIDGKLYVFGGRWRDGGGVIDDTLDVVEMYDPATDTWSTRSPMPTGRRAMAVGTLNGRIQIMGGEKTLDGQAFEANEQYDPATDTWAIMTPMLTPRHGMAFATLNGVVYTIGGGAVGGSDFTDIVEVFVIPD